MLPWTAALLNGCLPLTQADMPESEAWKAMVLAIGDDDDDDDGSMEVEDRAGEGK